ncbi:MAG TPA: hypothetical protein VIB39_17715 [Candidatus Angelobacter sp.]
MKNYGRWQPDAIQAVEAVLAGDPLAMDSWQATGDANVVRDYKLSKEHSLYFLPFGSIAKHEWPFFTGVTRLNSPADLDALFPREGKLFTQSRTNKSLAIAVAGNPSGATDYAADLIVISDFLMDANMNDAEIRYVDDFEASSASATPLILLWKKDPRLQIKFIRIRPASPPRPDDTEVRPVATVRLVEALHTAKPEALQMRWRIDGAADVKNYSVYVRDEKGRTVFSAAHLLDKSVSYANPAAGKLNWYVIANLNDGSQLKSAVGNVVVPPSSSSGMLFLLLLVLAGAGFLGYRWWQKRGIKETPAGEKSQGAGEM